MAIEPFPYVPTRPLATIMSEQGDAARALAAATHPDDRARLTAALKALKDEERAWERASLEGPVQIC